MGIHDYVCFVQQNGQCLQNFELLDPDDDPEDFPHYERDGSGNGKVNCTIVIVPDTIDLSTISLPHFVNYPVFEGQYCWGEWDFPNLPGYCDYLMGDKPTANQAVWQHPNYPGHNLVNFDPFAYECFVTQKYDPLHIPYGYYGHILQQFPLINSNKAELFQIITCSSIPNSHSSSCSSLLGVHSSSC